MSTLQLSNNQLTLALAVPGASGSYCGTRFSWAGIISAVTWGEHHLFGPWKPGPLPLDLHDNVSGTAGEFGMGTADMPPPLGFDEAAPGDGFVKIDVADNQVTVRNLRTGLMVEVVGDRPILRYHFFAVPGAVCPEPFVEINAAPGETTAWAHRYELSCGGA